MTLRSIVQLRVANVLTTKPPYLFSVSETIALWIFLEEIFPATTRQISILWRVDNTVALAHIRKEGGLKGRRLLREAEKILILLDSRQLRILPAFIPLEENLQADAVSRFQLVPDWHLDPQVFRQISSLWGTPQIDLVASVGANGAIHVLAGCGLTGSHRRPQHEVELQPGLPLSSHSPPQEGCEETGGVEGGFSPRHSILGGPDMVREPPVSSSPRSPLPLLP
jgi:hypothetical protein